MIGSEKVRNLFQSAQGDQDLAASGWFDHHPSNGLALPAAPGLDAFVGSCWPMSSNYYSPLNPVWLMQIPDTRMLARKPYWFIRDGAVPLSWFFFRHPKAPASETKIFIDEDLLHLVPQGWSTHVGTYRLFSDAARTRDTRAILLGICAESYVSLKVVRENMKRIRESEDCAKSFDIYLPTRWSAGHDEEREAYHASYFREVFQKLRDNCRVLTRTELTGTFDLQNTSVWDINEKLMIADNSLVHALLKKGAQWPRSRPIESHENYVRLSNFHGCVLNSNPALTQDRELQTSIRSAQRFHDRIEDVYRTTAFREFPWPQWFAQWIQANGASATETPTHAKVPRKKNLKTAKKKTKKR